MNIGDVVTIGGRTMLRPGFSLVGLQGVVMPSAPNTPAGCTTVLVDWENAGYEDDNLPLFVNVATAHLEPAEEKPNEDTRPVLGLVANSSDAKTPKTASDKIVETENIESEERPRLRLL